MPTYSLPLPQYPIGLVLQCQSLLVMHGSQYVTNQLRESQYMTLITNQRRLLAAKFFSSSHDEDQALVTELYGAQTQQLLHKKDELGQILSPITICLNKLCSTLVQLVFPLMALKIIILYVQGYEKKKIQTYNHGLNEKQS